MRLGAGIAALCAFRALSASNITPSRGPAEGPGRPARRKHQLPSLFCTYSCKEDSREAVDFQWENSPAAKSAKVRCGKGHT